MTQVKAETFNGTVVEDDWIRGIYVKKSQPNGNGYKYEQARWLTRSTDGQFVYCLQPYVSIDNNYKYNVQRSDYLQVLNMSQAQWERVSLLSYYGYGYGNHTDSKWYAITQLLIWRTVSPNTEIFFTNSLNGTRNDSLYVDEINEINNLVSQHYIKPNFNNNNLVLPIGQSASLNDSNNVLSKYTITSTNNVSASINGNTLNIQATGIGTGTINLKKSDTKYSTPPIVYFSPYSQDVMAVGYYDPVPASFSLKVIGGRVEIHKLDSDKKVSIASGEGSLTGAQYGIYTTSGEKIATLTTDGNAYAISDYLPSLGEFILREEVPSLGYTLDKNVYRFQVTEDNLLASVDVFEKVIEREIELTKVYASDETKIMTPEVGIQFGFYDKFGKEVAVKTTDKNGKLTLTLPYGTYDVKQLNTTSGHEKVKDFKIEVKTTGDKFYYTISNAEITSRVKVIKVDQDGKNITKAGIKFKIKNLDTNEYVSQTVSYPTPVTYTIFETDENGVLITPYPLGTGHYQLEELDQVIDGYTWNSQPLKFTIDENSKIISDDNFNAILEIKFTNQEVKGTIEINKIGEKIVLEDETYKYVDIKLKNVEFGLYDESGNLVKKFKTDNNGYVKIENLKLGKYVLKELSSSENHILDEKEYEFELKYKDQYTPVVSKSFTFKNYLPKGSLDFTKVDLTTVEIYKADTDELIFSGVTDENGKIKITDLFVGKFYIIETEAATSYKLSDEKVFFEIKSNGDIVKAKMTNEKITGSLDFTKVDFSDGKPIPNTLIEIYKADTDELVFSGRTDENGKVVIEELEYGKYYILEKECEGYVLNDEKMYFEILEDGEIIKSTMENTKITGSLDFTKVDVSDGKPIPNTLIEIYKVDTDELIFSGRTDENGKIVIEELEYGKYYILEKECEGYILNDEKMYFEILENGKIVKATMENTKKDMPKTFNTDLTSFLIIGGTAIAGLGLLLYAKKKKD